MVKVGKNGGRVGKSGLLGNKNLKIRVCFSISLFLSAPEMMISLQINLNQSS